MPLKLSAETSIRRGAMAALAFAFSFLPAQAGAQEADPVILESDHLIITGTADSISTGTAAGFATIVANSVIRDNVINVSNSVNRTELVNSLHGNQGIVQVNQNSGIIANQANVVAIAVAAGAGTVPIGATILSEAVYENNVVNAVNVQRSNVIDNVLDGSAGIAQIGQNAGNLNRNLNALAIAVGIGTGDAVIVSDGNLAAAAPGGLQVNSDGNLQGSNTIQNIGNFSGIGQIAQTAGDGNVAVNSMSIGIAIINK